MSYPWSTRESLTQLSGMNVCCDAIIIVLMKSTPPMPVQKRSAWAQQQLWQWCVGKTRRRCSSGRCIWHRPISKERTGGHIGLKQKTRAYIFCLTMEDDAMVQSSGAAVVLLLTLLIFCISFACRMTADGRTRTLAGVVPARRRNWWITSSSAVLCAVMVSNDFVCMC